ncbi:hypothetical protein IPN35_04005 [Candidatus Peregrinibacteria bacterium]|nr:MAG: hypothetical protein IPN35_04005 [Candidatus Peregrinibacteria bacterium]
MNKKNVEILWEDFSIPGIEVPTSEGIIDLHNGVYFAGMAIDTYKNTLSLIFECHGERLFDDKEYTCVEFCFINFYGIQVTERNEKIPLSEDATLEYVSMDKGNYPYVSFIFAFRGERTFYITAENMKCFLSSSIKNRS